MGPAWLFFLFSAINLALSLTIELDNAAEGIICRSYFFAKTREQLKNCKSLWLEAKIMQDGVDSIDCSSCKSLLGRGHYGALVSRLSRLPGSSNISASDLRELSNDLKNHTLLCSLFGYCNQGNLILPTLKFTLNSTCDDCKKIIDDVRNLIQDNETKTAIASYIKKAICFELPLQIVDVCKRTIDSYIGVLMDLAASNMKSGPTCALFGLCSDQVLSMKASDVMAPDEAYSWIKRPHPSGFEFFHSRLSYAEQMPDAEACSECERVFSRIRDQTKNPQFDQTLKNVIKDKLCESFGYFKSMCEAAISSEVDQMINSAAEMNITDLCFFFNQCTSNVSESAKRLKASVMQQFSPMTMQAQVPFVCPLCEAVMKKLIDLTLTNRSEAAIVYVLEEVCELLPTASRDKCLKFVEQYSDWIVREIVAGTAPEVICLSLGVCEESHETLKVDTECKLCEVIVSTIYDNIEDNATKDDIVKNLETVCNYLPYLKDQCLKLVDNYASQAIDMLINDVPPKEVCAKLGFCLTQVVVEVEVKDSCAICEVVFAELYTKLRDNATVENIESALQSICNYMPSRYAASCRSFVEQDTVAILDLVMQKYSPKKICEELSICYYQGPPKSGKCDVCEEIIDYIYTKLEDDATADDIEKVLETVCDYLPMDSLKSTCHQYVKAYTQVLIDLLVKNVPSKEVCQELGLCPSDRPVSSLCSGGPAAWCRDESTARLCSREGFCKEFIWNNSRSPNFPNSKPRSSVVRKYDCRKLVSAEERCLDERLMRICGYEAFCADYKRPVAEQSDACRQCRNLLTQRLTYGTFVLDCSIYVRPSEKLLCERVRALKVPGRVPFTDLESICKEQRLCNTEPETKPSVNHRSLVGADLCLWGPSVTCRDVDIATSCGVTSYCQQHVWKANQPPARAARVPKIPLVDCSRPLSELCVSSTLRYCGSSVLEQCRSYAASESNMRQEMCKDRPLSFCLDSRMVDLCGMGEYCEAMSLTPTPPPLVEGTNEERANERCRLGPSFACQTYANAVLCGEVEFCRRHFWL